MATARTGALLFAGCALATLLAAPGCSSKKRMAECEMLRGYLFLQLPDAPRQSDMSHAGQAENWKWRAERIAERRHELESKAVGTSALTASRVEIVNYLRSLEDAASGSSEAWAKEDDQGMRQRVGRFETLRGPSVTGPIEARLLPTCP